MIQYLDYYFTVSKGDLKKKLRTVKSISKNSIAQDIIMI